MTYGFAMGWYIAGPLAHARQLKVSIKGHGCFSQPQRHRGTLRFLIWLQVRHDRNFQPRIQFFLCALCVPLCLCGKKCLRYDPITQIPASKSEVDAFGRWP
jgi:hypothetical protein